MVKKSGLRGVGFDLKMPKEEAQVETPLEALVEGDVHEHEYVVGHGEDSSLFASGIGVRTVEPLELTLSQELRLQ